MSILVRPKIKFIRKGRLNLIVADDLDDAAQKIVNAVQQAA
jgi:hypothetical protein